MANDVMVYLSPLNYLEKYQFDAFVDNGKLVYGK